MAAATVEDVQRRGMMAYRNSDDLSRVRGQQWVGAYQNSSSSENDSGCLLLGLLWVVGNFKVPGRPALPALGRGPGWAALWDRRCCDSQRPRRGDAGFLDDYRDALNFPLTLPG